ncbi:conserved serine-proline rich protein [Aspergillus lentulus]|uniref:Conserved serine-proline rich protein n=1 Tax=Aspergillus lentulus TaxID=293939 RepID=A0ABQ0ZZ48_ASPLE|nr:conserved serine-proline rich protein [Aspergillus lentulus]
MQSTPSIPYTPSPSVPPVPTIDLLPLNNILYPPDAGLEFDRAIQNHGDLQDPMLALHLTQHPLLMVSTLPQWDNKKKLELIVKRVAQVLLYLNYVSLLKKGEPNVVTRILNNYHDDPNKAKTKASRQKNFHTYHVRLGRWWWRLAARLGLGILLVADDLVMNMFSNRFTDDQIDVLITFALRTRPGTIHLYRSLAPVAKSLLSGELPANLR